MKRSRWHEKHPPYPCPPRKACRQSMSSNFGGWRQLRRTVVKRLSSKSGVETAAYGRSAKVSSNLSSNSHGLATSAPPTKRGRNCRQCQTPAFEHGSKATRLPLYLRALAPRAASHLGVIWTRVRLLQNPHLLAQGAGVILLILAALVARPASSAAIAAHPSTSAARFAGSSSCPGEPHAELWAAAVARGPAHVGLVLQPACAGLLPPQLQRTFHA